MMNISDLKNLYGANMGLEKECLRVTPDGCIAKTPHPFKNDKNIKMDFAEPQTEIATPPCRSAEALYNELFRLHKKAAAAAKKSNELLWCLSNPPLFGSEADIPTAIFEDDPEETEFRELLARKYGRKIMLYSGIHFNFSYSDALIDELYKNCGGDYPDKRRFKDSLYLAVAKNCFKYIWFPVYLTAASPVYDASFADGEQKYGGRFCGWASMRNSPHGYKNKQPLPLDLSSCESYVRQIRRLVDGGQLMHISELYSPVRIKAKKGHSTTALERDGIDFLELRVFDLNPFSPAGFAKDDIYFLHLFMIYILSLGDFEWNYERQLISEQNRYAAARFDAAQSVIKDGGELPLYEAAGRFSENMRAFFARRGDRAECEILDRVFARVFNPSLRYCEKLVKTDAPYIERGLALSKAQLDAACRG